MSFAYPVQLNIEKRDCLIVGAGKVAYRKARTLLDSGALVTVIAPDIDVRFRDICCSNLILLERTFRPEDVCGRFLVFAATSDKKINQSIVQSAKCRGILVNVADDAQSCDFIVPARLEKKDLMLTISTNGKSPGYARMLKEYLDKYLNASLNDALWVAMEYRNYLKEVVSTQSERERLLRQLNLESLLAMLENDEREEVLRKVKECL